MKLSELEKLANETGYMGRADQEDILILCATFREMLRGLKDAQGTINTLLNYNSATGGYDEYEATIKKAEEML